MNYALYRYWTPPARWRRWPPAKRVVVSGILVAVALSLSLIPLGILLPARFDEGFGGYWVEFIGMIYLALVNLGAILAGATLIAAERERGTWDALLLAPIGVRALVRAKFLSRCLLCAGVVGLTLPFWLGWAFEVLAVNDGWERAYYTANGTLPPLWTALRMGIFLLWLSVRIVGRVVPFVAFGMAISARCKRVRTALSLSALLAGGLAAPLLVLFGVSIWKFWDVRDSVATFLYWPLLPNHFTEYTAHSLLSTYWKADLGADVLWLVILPTLFYWLAVRWSRLSAPSQKAWLRLAKRG